MSASWKEIVLQNNFNLHYLRHAFSGRQATLIIQHIPLNFQALAKYLLCQIMLNNLSEIITIPETEKQMTFPNKALNYSKSSS